MIDLATQRYALVALAAAALFGASTPPLVHTHAHLPDLHHRHRH